MVSAFSQAAKVDLILAHVGCVWWWTSFGSPWSDSDERVEYQRFWWQRLLVGIWGARVLLPASLPEFGPLGLGLGHVGSASSWPI